VLVTPQRLLEIAHSMIQQLDFARAAFTTAIQVGDLENMKIANRMLNDTFDKMTGHLAVVDQFYRHMMEDDSWLN